MTQVLGRVYCWRCAAYFTLLGSVTRNRTTGYRDGTGENEVDQTEAEITSCPSCGHELTVLELHPQLRQALEEARTLQRESRPWEEPLP